MLKEIDGKGPYCSLVMAVVVVKDVLLFAAFAVNIELFRAVGFLPCLPQYFTGCLCCGRQGASLHAGICVRVAGRVLQQADGCLRRAGVIACRGRF